MTNTNPELGNMRPHEATVDLRPFDLGVLGCLASRQIRGQGPLSGTFRVQLSEEEVVRLVSSSAPGMRVTGVDLTQGGVSEPQVGVGGSRSARIGEVGGEIYSTGWRATF